LAYDLNSADSDIFVSNGRLTSVANITHGLTHTSFGPSWSPDDGKWIAFVAGAEGSSAFVVSADGKHGLFGDQGPTRIPFPYPYVTGVDWFPDVRPGAWFLIEAPSPETGVVGLYRVGLDGSGLELLVLDARNAAISPDGQEIAFVRESVTGADLYIEDLGTMTERRLTSTANRSEVEPAWSPDGKWIAFTRVRQLPHGVSRSDVGIVRPDGSDLHMVIHGQPYDASSPAWRPAKPLPPAKRVAC
jgi:Tol biopolymer transport system component